MGTIQLDSGKIVSGSSQTSLTELNLELPLYLGGYRFAYSLSRQSGISTGLDGSIQRLIINGNSVDHIMDDSRDSKDVSRFEGPPCHESPCQNGGWCRPFFRSYVCKCTPDFMGQQCERGKLRQERQKIEILLIREKIVSKLNY
jgi:hypothetical protein